MAAVPILWANCWKKLNCHINCVSAVVFVVLVTRLTKGFLPALTSQSILLRFSKFSFFVPFPFFAEVKLNDTWKVGNGENSKEVDVQTNRHRREKDTIYQTIKEMPSNPKEPWDLEMDYDDTLTPEIPIEQLPDGDSAEVVATPNDVATHAVQSVASTSSTGNAAPAEPDLELLAVLLKNPELVFALTSGQAGNIPNEETMKLLDMIKRSSVNLGLGENTNGNLSNNAKSPETVEVSLPSPTPSNDPRTVRDLSSYCNNYLSKILSCLMPPISFPFTPHFCHVGLHVLRVESR